MAQCAASLPGNLVLQVLLKVLSQITESAGGARPSRARVAATEVAHGREPRAATGRHL